MINTESWKDIDGFYGYQVSSEGGVRSFLGRGKNVGLTDTPHTIKQSDDGNGYMKVMLYNSNENKRYCKKVHRLVAEAFIPRASEDLDTVDHILSGPEGKLDNSVSNLRWMSRASNIKKAYRDGMCDDRIEKSKKKVAIYDTVENVQKTYLSIGDAADDINVDRSSISHNVHRDVDSVKDGRYECSLIKFSELGKEALLYDPDDDWTDCDQQVSWL